MRLIVYSHDAFGLGNIRRMLAICQYLLDTTPSLSILLLSGSPLLHSFRLPRGLDYIKLPCLSRDATGELSAKYLQTQTEETMRLRSAILQIAIANFKPDLILVDKKPYGLQGELQSTLQYIQQFLPKTKLVLLLRDILDRSETTIQEWQKNDYYSAIQQYYDRVLIVGTPEIFDLVREYRFPTALASKTRYCGYIDRPIGEVSPWLVRQKLGLQSGEKLVLITAGGGEDGYHLLESYLLGLLKNSPKERWQSLVITGPEMSAKAREKLRQIGQAIDSVAIEEFTSDITSYIHASDLVVSMAGYNTICEILALKKTAIVVPRIQPVQEQLIRAERMASLGLLEMIYPDTLTGNLLIQSISKQLKMPFCSSVSQYRVNFNALPKIKDSLEEIVGKSLGSIDLDLVNLESKAA
jgi:predicted glycosyltransferase